MQIITKEEQDAQQRATIVGGLKGLAGGLGVALPASYLLYRRYPYYRALQPSLKAFGVILVAVPAFVISAERAGQKFEREQWCACHLSLPSCSTLTDRARCDKGMTQGRRK